MPTVASSVAELLGALQGSAHLDGERLVIDDERVLDLRTNWHAWLIHFAGRPMCSSAVGDEELETVRPPLRPRQQQLRST